MKERDFFAFLLTTLSLVLVIVGFAWCFAGSYSQTRLDCDNFFVALKSEAEELDLEVGEGKLVKIELKNLGFEDEFKIKVDSPDWVVARPTKLRLKTGEAGDVFVYISPEFGAEGNYLVKISANSFCVHEEQGISVVV